MHPYHQDVVGRIAKNLDMQGTDPAHGAQPIHPQQRGAQPDHQGERRRAGKYIEIDCQAAQQHGPIFPEQRDVEGLLQRFRH